MYTLYIFDDSRPVTAIPSAGVLGGFVGYVFGMYQPQSYTPLPSTIAKMKKANLSHILCDLQWRKSIIAKVFFLDWHCIGSGFGWIKSCDVVMLFELFLAFFFGRCKGHY